MSKTFLIQIIASVVLIGIVLFGVNSTKNKETPNEEAVSASAVTAIDTNIINDTNDTTNMEQKETILVTMNTSHGAITLELWKDKAPNTVENFMTLSKNGFYDGTRFHRVIEGFMIQGGDPLSKDTAQINRWGTGGPGYQFADEIHAENHNLPGTISMANAGPNTNGSQFFINVADNSYLDTKHTVFGKVVEGYDIVETISMVDTIPGADRPVEDVVIESIEIQ